MIWNHLLLLLLRTLRHNSKTQQKQRYNRHQRPQKTKIRRKTAYLGTTMRPNEEQETPDQKITIGLTTAWGVGNWNWKNYNCPGFFFVGVPLRRHPARAVITARASLKFNYLICFDLALKYSVGTEGQALLQWPRSLISKWDPRRPLSGPLVSKRSSGAIGWVHLRSFGNERHRKGES